MAVGKLGTYVPLVPCIYIPLVKKLIAWAKKRETATVGILLLLLFHEIHVFWP